MANQPVYKRAKFDGAAGDIAVVAAVTGKKIRVHGLLVTTDTANGTARWEDGAGGTDLSGVWDMTVDSPVVLPFCEVGWFQTSAATALSLEATTGGMAGVVIYSEID